MHKILNCWKFCYELLRRFDVCIRIIDTWRFFLPHSPSTFRWIMTLQWSFSTLARFFFFSFLQCESKERKRATDLHVFLVLPGNGGPHAIFLPRQKRHASGGFLSGRFLEGTELRPIDGDLGELKRNSVGVGVIWQDETCNVLDELCSDKRSRRITASWQLLVNFKVGGFICRLSWRNLYLGLSGGKPLLIVSWEPELRCGEFSVSGGWSTGNGVGSGAETEPGEDWGIYGDGELDEYRW